MTDPKPALGAFRTYGLRDRPDAGYTAPAPPAGSNGKGVVGGDPDGDPDGPITTMSVSDHMPPAASFFDGSGLVVSNLGQYVQYAGRLRLGEDGRLYRYREGVYRGDGDTFARATVRDVLGDRFKKRHAEEVLAWLRAEYPSVPSTPPTRWVNTPGGLLDWRTGQLHEHTPEVVTTVQIAGRWDPAATCPAIDRFLTEVLPADAVDLVHELVGYCIYSGNPLRRAVLLLGPGRNGKSVLLDVIRSLLGSANVSAVALQVLAENRFAAAELYGRLANIAGDLDARAIRNTDVFKMATGGDPVMAERKHGHPFTFTPWCTFLFAANEPPISSDQTEAWFDRWLILPLDRRIPEGKVDPHLRAKLTTPAELSGLLNHAVAGLRRLLERGAFAEPPSVKTGGDRYRSRLDSVRGFVDEACHLDLEAWTARAALYRAYRTWCTEQGRLPVNAENFYARLWNDYPMRIGDAVRRGVRGLRGVALLTDQEHER